MRIPILLFAAAAIAAALSGSVRAADPPVELYNRTATGPGTLAPAADLVGWYDTSGSTGNRYKVSTWATIFDDMDAVLAGSSASLATVTASSFVGPLTGNAATATKLATARSINGVAFDGTQDISFSLNAANLTGTTLASGVTGSSLTSVGTLANLTVSGTISGSVSGNAATATRLATPRSINGVAFDGTADITISGGGGGGSVASTGITDSTAAGRALLTAATAKAQVTLLTTVTTNGNTSITLADSDSGTVLYCTAGSAVTITVPSTLSAGFTVAVIQGGAGQVTFTAGAGSTVGSYLNMSKTAGQNASASLLRVGSGAYHLSGNITP